MKRWQRSWNGKRKQTRFLTDCHCFERSRFLGSLKYYDPKICCAREAIMTKNRKMVLGSVLLVGLATGVLSDDKSGTNMTAKPAKGPQPAVVGTKGPVRSDLPVIGYLEKRDRLITIKSSAKGTVY